ncbi:Dihydrofolate reductase, partial [Operophtera brumata]
MSSKLKHSCEPNLLVVGLNDSVALVTLRTIAKGEELTISYIEHFYDFTINRGVGNAYTRATRLFLETRHMCDCRVCAQNWDSQSVVTVKMTNKQAALFEKVNAKQKSMDYECFNNMCAALDAFPVNSLQHKCAYAAVKEMMISPHAMTTKVTEPSKINAVIMGRVTWDCIPDKYRPLAGRAAMDHPSCDKVYLTEIQKSFVCDTFFPPMGAHFRPTTEEGVPSIVEYFQVEN